MKIITRLIHLIILLSLIACDTTMDIFEDDNNAPILKVKGSSHSEYGRHMLDSMKLDNVQYYLNYNIQDEENLDINVNIESPFGYQVKNDILVFSTQHVGVSDIFLSVEDTWGRLDTLTFKLICFDNLAPIPFLDVMELDDHEYGRYLLDASNSYDADAKFGGKIVSYRFFIDNKEFIKTTSSFIYYSFGQTGEYIVGLQVMDNNNQWSEIISQTIIR